MWDGTEQGQERGPLLLHGHGVSEGELTRVENWKDQHGKLKEKARFLGAIRRWDGKDMDNVRF